MTHARMWVVAVMVMAAVTGTACVQEPDDIFPFPASTFELDNGLRSLASLSIAPVSSPTTRWFARARGTKSRRGSRGMPTSSST